MVHDKIHLIRPGCLRPSIALTVQNRGLKHQSFIYLFVGEKGEGGDGELELNQRASTNEMIGVLGYTGLLR